MTASQDRQAKGSSNENRCNDKMVQKIVAIQKISKETLALH
jgi:hypothetical protein